MKHFLISVTVLFGIWMLFNASVSPPVLLVGAGVSLIIALIAQGEEKPFSMLRLTPAALAHALIYLLLFLWEVLRSNVDVALRVISPALPINPGIVEVRTRLKSPLARLILTSSITLTPGTLTVDIVDDRLFIHWIDVTSSDREAATEAIVRKFEKHLEVIYG